MRKARPLLVGPFLFVVVRFAFEDGVRTVNLFHGKRPDHLVRKRHRAEAHEGMGLGADARGKSIRPSNHKHHVAQPPVLKVLEVLRERQRTHGFPLFVQKNEVVHPFDEFVEDGGFCFFDGFGVFFALLELGIGGLDELKLAIVAHAVHVDPCALSDPAGLCFTDGQ